MKSSVSISVSISQVLKSLEEYAPSGTAEGWDSVGLLAGDPNWKTQSAIVGVDLDRDCLDRAVRQGARLIVNHHPCIFPKGKGLARIVSGNRDSIPSLLVEALQKKISVIAVHTNFDRCALEVVEQVSKKLGVETLGRLHENGSEALLKLVVFVPESHLEAVRNSICEAGAGVIGQYDYCSFGTEGQGTFRGQAGTQPFIGSPGKLETAQEVRLETILPKGLEQPVLRSLARSHPYEEVAYDLYPVKQQPSDVGVVRGLGYGFWGSFPRSLSFSEVSRRVKAVFGINSFILTGSLPRKIERIAFVAGKGASFLDHASALDCDLMITGEAGYHSALGASRSGMTVMEIGHRQSEKFFPMIMSQWLRQIGLKTFVADAASQRFIC